MTSFWSFFPFYVCGFALNQAITYLVPVHHSWLWFPKNAGFASGMVLAGYGFGSLIMDNVAAAVINPEGLKSDDPGFDVEITDNFLKMMRTNIIIWLGCVIIGIIFVFQGPIPEKKETKRETILPENVAAYGDVVQNTEI